MLVLFIVGHFACNRSRVTNMTPPFQRRKANNIAVTSSISSVMSRIVMRWLFILAQCSRAPGWSSISVPPAPSHGSIGIRWLWWYVLFSFLYHTPYVAHLLEYAVMVSRTSKVFSQGVPYVADKKDLSAPLATEPQAPSR